MIVQLLPDQVPSFWPDIKESIIQAVPPTLTVTLESLNNLLTSMLLRHMQVWVVVDQHGMDSQVQAVMVTNILDDNCSGTKILQIYSLYSLGNMSDELWQEGFDALKDFAKVSGCSKIGSYTQVEEVAMRAKQLGAKEDTFLYWDI